MFDFPNRIRWKRLLAAVLMLCLALTGAACSSRQEWEEPALIDPTQPFSVLILGDSQMYGACWEGGYANCISELYPDAQIFNLAQNGSLLANGDIRAQWDYYRSETTLQPDIILLDGGTNDMPYLKREEFKDTALPLVTEALCSLLEEIHDASPNTRIIYVLMPPFAEWEDSEDGPPSYEIQKHYWKQLKKTAGAYDYVTVVDLFSINPFLYPDAETYQKNLADSIHMNETGYRSTFPYINDAFVAGMEPQND